LLLDVCYYFERSFFNHSLLDQYHFDYLGPKELMENGYKRDENNRLIFCVKARTTK